MFQTILTLVRGAYADNEEILQESTALPLLRQQIREAAAALDGARRDLATAIAALKGSSVPCTRSRFRSRPSRPLPGRRSPTIARIWRSRPPCRSPRSRMSGASG